MSLSSPSPALREDREDRSSFVAEKPDPRDASEMPSISLYAASGAGGWFAAAAAPGII